MYCIAEQVVFPPLNEEERKGLLEKAARLRVYDILDAVADPRKRHGFRYELAFLLTCLLAALLCNCNSTQAVAQWCREHVQLLRQVFGARLFLTPSGSLYRKLLPRLHAQAVEEVLGRWIQARLHAAADEPMALDGKTVPGARTGEQAAAHLLSFCTHDSQETLFQVRVSEKTNEIPVAKAVLPTLPVAGRVVTSDALHTHADAHADHAHPARQECLHREVEPADLVCQPRYLFCGPRGSLPASRDLGSSPGTGGTPRHSCQHPNERLSRCRLASGCPGGRSDTYRHQERPNLDAGRLSHHRPLSQAGSACTLAFSGSRPLGHRKSLPLRARCLFPRRSLPSSLRQRPTTSGRLSQSRYFLNPSLWHFPDLRHSSVLFLSS
jgi:DDE_Tnp_1-associated